MSSAASPAGVLASHEEVQRRRPDALGCAPEDIMIIRRPFVTAITCAAVISLVACSKPAPTAGAAGETAAAPAAEQAAAEQAATPSSKALPHACDLLTAKDAEAVLGAGASVKRDSEDTCDLVTPNPVGPTLSIKIEELTDTWDGGDTMIAMDKNARKLPDIGDGGYTYANGSIAFKKGKAEVSVITSNYRGPLSKFDAAKLIAARVAAKM
jgi:hypothetical protein